MNKNTFLKLIFFSVLISFLAFIYPRKINSAAISNVKDVLCTSQYSYVGGVGSSTLAGSNILYIDMGGTFPSETSNNLFVGDTIYVGASSTPYVVTDIGTTGDIRVSPVLAASDITPGGYIVHPVSSCHTVTFDAMPTLEGEIWQFLLKASSTSNPFDSIPDQDGFDLGTLTLDHIDCPFGGTASVGTTTPISTSTGIEYYHVIECSLGVGVTYTPAVGETATLIIGETDNSYSFINPSPSHETGELEGYPEILPYTLRHLTSTGTVLDQTRGNVAVVEAVRVTATIDPTITFWIDNVGVTNVGTTFSGISGDEAIDSGAIYTTADQVIFGSLAIDEINQLAQRLNAVTNAAGGYVVTAYEAGTMTRIGGGETIPDTLCNGNICTITTAKPWTNVDENRSEFGYTMISAGSSIPFAEGDFKPFGIGCENAQPVMVNPAVPSITESAYAIYRITATTVQAAGDYEAKIIYTATSTF